MAERLFRFKEFEIAQEKCAMKINTDGVLLGAWVAAEGKQRILDIGMGSGVIAMMLAQRSEDSKIVGVEIDQDSYEEAKQNMQGCSWEDRLIPVHASIQDFTFETDDTFDLIVSNPPFFTGGTLSATQEKTVVRHSVKLPHGELLRSAYSLLDKDGDFAVVLPHIEGLRFIEMAEQCRFYCTKITEVFSFPDRPVERLLLNFRKEEADRVEDKLVIRSTQSEYTAEYKDLTKNFYLKF